MISWDRVKELRDEVGEDDFGEVVELFLEEVEEVIDRLRTAPDPAKFEDDMHFLKGCALNLGFETFSKICQEGEKNAAQSNTDAVDVPGVIVAFESSKTEFMAHR